MGCRLHVYGGAGNLLTFVSFCDKNTGVRVICSVGYSPENTVHFTVVKSQAILIIRLGVTEVIYRLSWGHRSYFHVTLYLLPASKQRKFYLVGYVQVQQFCMWTLLIDCHFDSNDVSV